MRNSKIHFDLAQENTQYQRDAVGAQMVHPARPEGSRQNHHAIKDHHWYSKSNICSNYQPGPEDDFKQTTCTTDYRNYNFSPRTIKEWNNSLTPDQ